MNFLRNTGSNELGEEQEDATRRNENGSVTEQQDLQLVFYVSLFGEQRWNFLAKVSAF